MRRTAITITSIFVLWSSFIYAVDNEEIPKYYQLQGAFEGQNIENLEAAEALYLKGPDISGQALTAIKRAKQKAQTVFVEREKSTVVFDQELIENLLHKFQNKEFISDDDMLLLETYWQETLPPRRYQRTERNSRSALGEGFEGSTFPPLGWQAISNNTANSVTQSSTNAHGGTYSARFSSMSSATDYNQYLITPKLTVATGDSLTFWHYKYYSWASDQISVGISTTDSSVASFTFGSALTSTNAWTRHAEDLSAYAGQDIYVAINYYGAYQYYLFVDDFAGPEADVNDPGLIFSEYIEGSSNNKAIELYNASLETINLDEYQIGQTSNGSTAGVWEYFHVFPTGATLAAGDVWVIANSSTSSTYFDTSNADEVLDYPSVVHHNGDDARSILHIVGTDTVVVDLIGETGPDPGSGWDVAGVTDATKDHTLIRKADVLWGNTDWASSAGTDSVTSEWLVHDQNYFTNLGGHPGDPCWDNAITLSVSSVSYGSEISYMLTNADGDTLASCFGCMANNQTNAHDLCLTAGAYSFWGKDSYGDSWNGGSFSVTAADGAVIVAGAVESTDGTNWVEFPFAIDEPVFLAADVDFAGVVIGGSDTKSLTVTNAGYGDAATMVISAVSSDNAAFAVSGTVPATLAAGESASFSVTYTASAEGDEAAEISVMYNSDTSTVGVHGYGVDAFFFEDFDPFTGSATELPMDGWTILDNNGDADSIPQLYKTWYHDDYGVDYSGNMVAYVGYSNGYVGDESIVTPMIHLDAPSKVTFQAYDYAYNLTVGITESSTIDSSAELTTIANILVDGFYTPTYEVVLPDVDSLRVAFTLSGTAYTYFNLDNVSVVALPNTYVSGVVTDSETGAAVTAMVEFGGVSENSSATGAYGLYGAEPGVHVLNVSADGYLDSHFTLEIAEGDSLVQNVVLVAQSSAAQEVYSTGFESGEDMGWTYTGGTNPFELSAGFTFYEDYYYPDTATVAPFAGDSMMVCSPTGYANSEFSWWMNLTDADMDLSGYSSAELILQANYWLEAGWDFAILLATWPEVYGGTYFYLDVNGDGVGDVNDALTGESNGWEEVTANLSSFAGTNYGVEVAVLLTADASIDLGFGVAIDDVVVNGFSEPRPWVTDLAAESYVNDQIALTWSDPSGGQRTVATSTITMNRTPVEIDPRNPRKAFEYETGEEELTIDVPASTTRDLVSYNVFRTDQYYFADYSGFDLIANTTDPAYTDTEAANHTLYYYYVTAVYDEGESLGSLWAAAGAGEVTDFAMADVAVDFEDSTFGSWQVLTFADNGWDVGETNTGYYGVPTHPDGGFYAFVNDDAVASTAISESRLLSPFFNLGDADHATVTFDYFNGYASQTLNVWAWIGWDTWIYVGELPANNASGWQTVSVDFSGFAGEEHVRVYFWYSDNGYWAGSAAIDNFSVSTLDGPTGLTLTETTESVTLHWTGVGGRAAGSRVNEYPNPVSEVEKQLASDLNDIRNPGQTVPHGEDNFSRVQGDSISNPFVIDALPFYTTGSTVGFTDDYDEVCPYSGSTSPDVVYELTIGDLEYPLVISLCESYYDTKVYVYKDDADTTLFACNDDFCTASHGQAWTSYLELSPDSLVAGTYFIVIDGYGGAEGDYVLDVYESEPPPAAADLMYNVYRDGNLLAGGLADTVTSFLDETASLNEACYVVTASVRTLGLEGDTLSYVETGASNEACGSVVNQPPEEFTLLSPADNDTIVITADNLTSNQLFAWSAAVDPNGSVVEYEACLSISMPFVQVCGESGTSTALFVPLSYVAAIIDSLHTFGGGVVYTFDWQVYASDGYDEVAASNGPRTITFDAGYVLGVYEELGVPETFALHQNHPNPFNPITNIRFDIPEESHVKLDIYNIAGQRVTTLVNGTMRPGFHSIRWNGTNDNGKQLASGMYIYRISGGKFTAVKKLVLMK
jgi:hypothetical protein